MSKFKNKWNNCSNPVRYVTYSILGVLGIMLLGLIFGLLIKVLWNWLMPEIFGLGTITYWQGIGLYLLGKLLFGFGKTNNNSNRVEVVDCCSKDKKEKNIEEIVVEESE